MRDKICIIGCGWLGLPLAKEFLKKGKEVKGSTTSESKLKQLSSEGILPFLIQFSTNGIIGNIKDCLKDCGTLILNIPPGFRKGPITDYVIKLSFLVSEIKASSVENVLFISSTSVYEDEPTFPIITEKSPTSSSLKAKELVAAENLFRNNSNFNTTILRFSGLFGNDRHPAKSLAGRKDIKNADAPVNLIHLNDCIGIIETIIFKNHWNIILNASSSPHPTRKAYYTKICEEMNLPGPMFDTEFMNVGKTIDSSFLERTLNYKYQVKL